MSSHRGDWTSVSVADTGGTSVVDYFTCNCTGIGYFKECSAPSFIDFLEGVDPVGLVPSTGQSGGYAIVSAKVDISDFHNSSDFKTHNNVTSDDFPLNRETTRKYQCREVPVEVLQDDLFIIKVTDFIRDAEHLEFSQGQIDSHYETVLKTYGNFMDKYMKPAQLPLKENVKCRRKRSPGGTQNWKTYGKGREKMRSFFVKSEREGRYRCEIVNLKNNFSKSRSLFDKRFQKEKRRYIRKWPVNVDHLNCTNPNPFWEEINKSKPKIQCKNPMEVYNETGYITSKLCGQEMEK